MEIPSTMDTESHHAQDTDFANPNWMEMGPFHSPVQSPPVPDYHGFAYGTSPVMPMEPSYGMSMPPPYASLPMAMSSHPWPSMLATQPQFPETTLPPVPIPPSISPIAPVPQSRRSSTSGSTPRRTLTDEDRRRMCLYHEENKTAKQTDIGALFGVERSTVSKVLRQKEKYLNPDDGSRSPIKRQKGRVPDIEKALSNWARNYQRQGYSLTDEMIREKAHFFASTCGGSDGKEKILGTSWLEKFKHKNNLMGARSRKSSTDVKRESESPTGLHVNPSVDSTTQTPNGISPVSPSGFTTPSPLSPTQNPENIEKELADGLAELGGDYQAEYQHAHSKSTTSLDTASLSAGVTSPTSTMVSDSPFTPTSQSRVPSVGSNSNRPRSQTFPITAVDPNLMTTDGSFDQLSTKGALQQSLSLSILESPLEEEEESRYVVDGEDSNVIKRNRSNPEIKTRSMYPPPFPKSNTVSPVSSPGSPTQDEARRALELVMNYFQNQPSGLGAHDFMTIGKLMEKLEIAKNHQNAFPGGLSRIDEHDDAPRVSKKRSIHTLS